MNLLPSTSFANEKNAARMALFAEAAYLHIEDRHAAARQQFVEEHPHGKSVWWNNQSAAGLVYVDEDHICIGIAGTTADELVKNDVSMQHIRDWSDDTGIPVPNDARAVGTTSEFLGYATLCYMSIERTLHEHFSLTLAELSKPMWMAGHSLGGAITQVLQCTTLFSHARAVVYGSPKVFQRNTIPPERLRVSIRRFADPVTYLPYGFQHALAETFYVKHPGSLRKTIPWEARPIALACMARAWLSGWKYRGTSTCTQGDRMYLYLKDLWSLR